MNKLLLTFIVGLFLLTSVSAFSWTDGSIVSYYKLDNATGVVYDMLGLNDGTIYNEVVRSVTGKINTAFNFTTGYVNLSSELIEEGNNFTVNAWIKSDIASQTGYAISQSADANGRQRVGLRQNVDKWSCGTSQSDNTQKFIDSTTNVDINNFQMVTCNRNATSLSIYVNGAIENVITWDGTDISNANNMWIGDRGSPSSTLIFNGTIDEVGIWNKSMNSTELSELYNYGLGLPYLSFFALSVVLSAPINDTTLSDLGTYFNVTLENASSYSYEFDNLTYYVWNGTGASIDLFNETTVTLTGDETLVSQYIDSFTLDDYIWNAYACYSNTTFSNCTWSANGNFTFDVAPFSTLDESYKNETLEGSTDLFTANFSFLSGQRLSSVIFNYNGTEYDVDFTEYATNLYYATKTFGIPLVNADTNVTFYWNLTLEGGFYQSSTEHNQTIKNLVIDNCSSGTNYLFNFSLVDEDTQESIVGTSSIKLDFVLSSLNGGYLPINYSTSFSDDPTVQVCSNLDLNTSKFRLDGVVEYSSTSRFVEFYNIQNYTLTNSTAGKLIVLYNLNSSKGQDFKITYKDTNFNTVPGAIIQIQRKYIEEGVFKVIEIPKIGGDGYTVAHLIREDEIYKLIVIKEGRILATFEDVIAHCQNPSFQACEININSFGSSVTPESFSSDGDYSIDLRYNTTSKVITAIFATLSGVPTLSSLNVTLYGSGTEVCSDALYSAGGTLTCTIPDSYENNTVIIKVYNDGVVKKQAIVVLGADPEDIYGNNIMFVGFIIIISLIGISITGDPMIAGIMLILSLVILIGLRLFSSPGIIGDGATILWAIVGIIILLIKGSRTK
jgi:hypothetical protein